jgi:uracil-DNA glycosylase
MAAETLSARLPALLRGVHPDWPPFLEEHGLLAAAEAALVLVEPDAGRLAPAEDLIFEFLRYFGPDDALVVIMGQDPYPRDAQGVCFSIAHGAPLKASLRPIIANLEHHGLARPHYRDKNDVLSGKVYSGDLRSWAAQGVLLMNAALTTRVGARGAHRKHWRTFTAGFVQALSARAVRDGRSLIHMLWGGDARAFAETLLGGVYQWTHPSPLVDNRLAAAARFERAPHFADANAALRAAGLRPIEWDPLGHTYAFTDGSCQRNGQPDAEASFAAFVMTGPLKNVKIVGRVAPQEYALADVGDLAKGFGPVTGTAVAPTNNRGEYLAWCWVLLLLLRGGVRGRVEVVSDCKLFIRTMEAWLPARRRKGTAEALKNFDLVCVGEALLAGLRSACAGVVLTHVRSHQPCPSPGSGAWARAFWYGNDCADRAAGAFLAAGGGAALRLETRSPALDWRLRGRFEDC